MSISGSSGLADPATSRDDVHSQKDVSTSKTSLAEGEITEKSEVSSQGGLDVTTDASLQSRVLTADEPITYRYLTFDTPLPPPNTTIRSGSATSRKPPAEPNLVRYTNPTLWSTHRKAYHMVLCCIATGLTAYCSGSYSPPAEFMMAQFNASRTAVLTGITTFCMGFALAPMALAPFSEINGRYPVFAVSGVVFVVFQVVCGLVPTLAGMLVARFLVGVGGSVFSTMIGGVIADLWDKEGRNTPMAIFSGSVLVGTGLGPLVSAVIVNRCDADGDQWKWVFWHQIIMDGILMTLIVMFFKESRGSVVLSRKGKALNRWYEQREKAGYYGVWLRDSASGVEETGPETGPEDEETKVSTTTGVVGLVRLRWRVKSDEERGSLRQMMSISLLRPFRLLLTEPVVFFFSLWVSFAWAILYLTFASIPYVFETVYGWDIESAGYVFSAMIVGAVISTVIGVMQDDLLKHPQWRAENWSSSDESSSERAGGSVDNNNIKNPRHHGGGGGGGGPRARLYSLLRRRFPVEAPESRLYFTCITATLLPIGLFIFGFTARPETHWASPAVAIGLATMGIFSVYLATFNYLADVYHAYASSALAAQSCCRNVMGGVFPLVALPLFRNLGNAGAGGLLGGIGLALTLVPWVLVAFGSKVRARSKFALVLEKAD